MRSTASNPNEPPSPVRAPTGLETAREEVCSERVREHLISTPLSGVFYRHPGPGKPPYVTEGGTVEVGQVVGLVEILKQFSEVTSAAAGILDRFTVADLGEMCAGTVVAVVRVSH